MQLGVALLTIRSADDAGKPCAGFVIQGGSIKAVGGDLQSLYTLWVTGNNDWTRWLTGQKKLTFQDLMPGQNFPLEAPNPPFDKVSPGGATTFEVYTDGDQTVRGGTVTFELSLVIKAEGSEPKPVSAELTTVFTD